MLKKIRFQSNLGKGVSLELISQIENHHFINIEIGGPGGHWVVTRLFQCIEVAPSGKGLLEICEINSVNSKITKKYNKSTKWVAVAPFGVKIARNSSYGRPGPHGIGPRASRVKNYFFGTPWGPWAPQCGPIGVYEPSRPARPSLPTPSQAIPVLARRGLD